MPSCRESGVDWFDRSEVSLSLWPSRAPALHQRPYRLHGGVPPGGMNKKGAGGVYDVSGFPVEVVGGRDELGKHRVKKRSGPGNGTRDRRLQNTVCFGEFCLDAIAS
ncbi:hypothetical protein Ahu01nite_036480 [Winogradskya humida]|uniref:Uncharacterized protein n=1 Tax=Winogradskya humida TaxID=113566 RepID=A0ABQ3ZPQ6_9ACTN|nr:hypothetical protein Ahu01nite_036480 [Actinoplanes humidus]